MFISLIILPLCCLSTTVSFEDLCQNCEPYESDFSLASLSYKFAISVVLLLFFLKPCCFRNIIACSRRMVTYNLIPGESVFFNSPNYPSDYDSRSRCAWKFQSTTDITINCSNFHLQLPSKWGKCYLDVLKLDSSRFCGTSLPSYSGSTSIRAVFRSNWRLNYSGFWCSATAESEPTTSTEPTASTNGTGGSTTTSEPDCINVAPTPPPRGVETQVNEYPWQAGMVLFRATSLFCGGSVISSKHIITAAHCTEAVTTNRWDYQVLVGAHDLTSAAASQLIFNADRFIQHSDYDNAKLDNDISIIVLSDSIDFTNSKVRPVCLPDSNDNAYDSVTATVSGWGALESGGSFPDVLMEV
ncbi:unnamed protein product, partial [Meganyctiphanes norvegica]